MCGEHNVHVTVGSRWVSSTETMWAEFWWFLCCYKGYTLERTTELSLKYNSLMSSSLRPHGRAMCVCVSYLGKSDREVLGSYCTYPQPNFNGGLVNSPLKLGHGWVITRFKIQKAAIQLTYTGNNPAALIKPPKYIDGLAQKKCNPSAIDIYDDVIKWKYFPRYSPFVRGIHPDKTIGIKSMG